MHELGGEPVEQLGVRRPFALRAEIVERLGKADAEELPPHAIDEDARGERIARGDQPVGEVEAGGALAAGIELAEERGDGGLDDLARFIHPVAAPQDAGLGGGGGFGDHHARDGGIEQGGFLFQVRDRDQLGEHFGRRPFIVRGHGGLLLRGALVFLDAEGLEDGIGNLFAFVGGGPGILGWGKLQAEAAGDGAAVIGIVMEPHGHEGIGGGLDGLGESQREDDLGILVVGGDGPSGLGIAIEGGGRRMRRRGHVQVGGAEREGELAAVHFGFHFGHHQAVGSAGDAEAG